MLNVYTGPVDRSIGHALNRPLKWVCARLDNFFVARVLAGVALILAMVSVSITHTHSILWYTFGLVTDVFYLTLLAIHISKIEKLLENVRRSGNDVLDGAAMFALSKACRQLASIRISMLAILIILMGVTLFHMMLTPFSAEWMESDILYWIAILVVIISGYVAVFFNIRPTKRIRERVREALVSLTQRRVLIPIPVPQTGR